MLDNSIMEIFAVTDSGKTDDGKMQADFPDYPGEKPSKAQLIAWVNKWTHSLETAGYSAQLRRETPFDLEKLKPRPLLTVPDGADAARKAAIEATLTSWL